MKIKAIKIDVQCPFTAIYFEEIEDDLKDIYSALDCDIFERVIISETEDILIDGEGLQKGDRYDWGFCFTSEFGTVKIAVGNGIIVGVNENGDNVDCSYSLQEISDRVTFFGV